jgi:hypothetical protein
LVVGRLGALKWLESENLKSCIKKKKKIEIRKIARQLSVRRDERKKRREA